MQPRDQVNLTNASVESNQAIPKASPKVTTKESPKGENSVSPTVATYVTAHTLTSSPRDVSEVVLTPKMPQESQISGTGRPEEPLTAEDARNQQKHSEPPKSDEKPKASRGKPATPSLGASLLLDVWDETNGRLLARTNEQVQAAEELARIKATGDDLKNVQERLLSQKDGFWRGRGVSLKNVANNFHLAALGPIRPPDSRSTLVAPPATATSPQPVAIPADQSPSRKLLRRIPSATPNALLPIGKQPEVRVFQ